MTSTDYSSPHGYTPSIDSTTPVVTTTTTTPPSFYQPPTNLDPRRDILQPPPVTGGSISKSALVARGITGASGLTVGTFLTVDASFASAWGLAPGGYLVTP